MSVEKMMNRLRSFSQGKAKDQEKSISKINNTNNTEKSIPSTPSKEDIISTIDAFGNKIEAVPNGLRQEDNNNMHKRQGSEGSVDSEGWMEVASQDTEPTITSFTHSYSLEYEKLFLKPNYLKHLRNYSIKGNLRSSRFRSIAWKLFLEVLPEDSAKWVDRTRTYRNKYEEIKNRLIVNPRTAFDNVDLSLNNPLSQEEESPWNRFFQDNELRLTIKQDVIRTFPEIQFYHSEDVRDLMTNILFCYCRDNMSLSYRQGMHELLAPIIFVLHCDHQAFLHASEIESLEDVVKEVLDPKYLEYDAYAMFSQVMETVEPWYVSKEVYPTKSQDPASSQPFSRPQDLNPSNVIVTKLTRIQDYLLKKADHELHMHLERLEIAPQIYGIRWIRLLFGREFPMQDLLVLWDAIFADGIGFDLVDYIFVAMLLYIRDHLLSIDYPSCLSTLMRYPPVGDIHFFIEKARHIRDPHQIPRPPNYTYQNVNKAERTKVKDNQKAASPTPGNVPQHKRGSTASMSQVEDTMFRSVHSSGSLIKAETQSLRSAVSTPDDTSTASSPTKYNTLPGRSKAKAKRRTELDKEYEAKITTMKGELNDKESMCRYCASKLDVHILRLQAELLHQPLDNEDEILVAIAGIKQVRDVLKGTLKFSHTLLDEDEVNIDINDDHYNMEITRSPDSEVSPEGARMSVRKEREFEGKEAEKKRMFYMSSEENSEVLESPSDSADRAGTLNAFKLPTNREFEMNDYKIEKSSPSHGKEQRLLQLGGPNVVESELSKSWSPDSERTNSSLESDLEESPNPLYRIRHGSYNV